MFTNKSKLSTMEVCYLLGIAPATLSNWYRYVNETPEEDIPKNCPGLPPYEQESPRGRKFWNPLDVHKLYEFQKWVPKGRLGVMANISKDYWAKDKKQRFIEKQEFLYNYSKEESNNG